MTTTKVSNLEELHSIFAKGGKTVVSFGAPGWCVPCRRLAPHFLAASNEVKDATFVEVDIDEAVDIREAYNIQSVPQIHVFDGWVKTGEVKSRTAPAIINALS